MNLSCLSVVVSRDWSLVLLSLQPPPFQMLSLSFWWSHTRFFRHPLLFFVTGNVHNCSISDSFFFKKLPPILGSFLWLYLDLESFPGFLQPLQLCKHARPAETSEAKEVWLNMISSHCDQNSTLPLPMNTQIRINYAKQPHLQNALCKTQDVMQICSFAQLIQAPLELRGCINLEYKAAFTKRGNFCPP